MTTTQLSLTNEALGVLEQRSLVATTDATESGRVMLANFPLATADCLEAGHWKFCTRIEELTPSVTEIPTIGYSNAFAKPDYYIRLSAICSDEGFNSPLRAYDDRGAFWYADLDKIYVAYTSNQSTWGGDVTLWPASFRAYFVYELAVRSMGRLAPSMGTAKVNKILAMYREAKLNALAKDAVLGPTQELPRGRWSSSRGRGARPKTRGSTIYGT